MQMAVHHMDAAIDERATARLAAAIALRLRGSIRGRLVAEGVLHREEDASERAGVNGALYRPPRAGCKENLTPRAI